MTQHAASPAPSAPTPLANLDRTTVRALADAGYIDHAAYVDLARARGWHDVGVTTVRPPGPADRMAQQTARSHVVSVSHAITVVGHVSRFVPAPVALPHHHR